MGVRVVVDTEGLDTLGSWAQAQVVQITAREILELAEEGRELGIEFSSGSWTLQDLREMGHPFSRDFPKPFGPYFPAEIGVDTGEFQASWDVVMEDEALLEDPESDNERIEALEEKDFTAEIINFSPVAAYLVEGTSRMIERPIGDLIADRLTE